MRRDRAVVALGLDDALKLPHGVLAELVQVRPLSLISQHTGSGGRALKAKLATTTAFVSLHSNQGSSTARNLDGHRGTGVTQRGEAHYVTHWIMEGLMPCPSLDATTLMTR